MRGRIDEIEGRGERERPMKEKAAPTKTWSKFWWDYCYYYHEGPFRLVVGEWGTMPHKGWLIVRVVRSGVHSWLFSRLIAI